jgi:hypothetical protein
MNVIYTCLFGEKEILNEQDLCLNSEFRLICFTNRDNIKSSSWEIIRVEPMFKSDFGRSSRHPKIMPQEYVDSLTMSFYIDNSIKFY